MSILNLHILLSILIRHILLLSSYSGPPQGKGNEQGNRPGQEQGLGHGLRQDDNQWPSSEWTEIPFTS